MPKSCLFILLGEWHANKRPPALLLWLIPLPRCLPDTQLMRPQQTNVSASPSQYVHQTAFGAIIPNPFLTLAHL